MQKPPLLQLEEGGGLQRKYIWLWKISQARQAEVSASREGAQPMLSQGQNECWTQWTKKTLKVWVASISDLPKLSSVLTFHSSHKELSFHQGFAPRQNSSPIQLDLLQTYCNCSGLTTASTILKCHCSQKFNSSLAHGSGSALSVSEMNTTLLPPGSPGTGSSFIPDSVVPSLSFSFPLAAWDLKNRQKFENKDEKSRIRRYLHHSS